MLIGRFLVIIPALAIAGSLAGKKRLAVTGGTMPTHGPLFGALLLGAIVLLAALTVSTWQRGRLSLTNLVRMPH